MNDSVNIALATCNGGKFLPDQLLSIAKQSLKSKVIVGDDCSTDDSLSIVNNWSKSIRSEVLILPSEDNRLGVVGNFNRILSSCDADFVACCDQDDIWDREHLNLLHGAAKMIDDRGTPTIAVGDMRVMNVDGDIINDSFWKMQAFDPDLGSRIQTAAVMNVFPGCAMLMNRALLDLALPIPPGVVMHDWWLVLCAAALGKIIVVNAAVGSYRIHPKNVLGAKRFSVTKGVGDWLAGRTNLRKSVVQAAIQCKELIDRHRMKIGLKEMEILDAASRLSHGDWMSRRILILNSGLCRHPWQRQFSLLLRG
jgi:glycosyltransferase involved in cell wall biosynthesis